MKVTKIVFFTCFLAVGIQFATSARPDDSYVGWRMVDRFKGFRFHLTGSFERSALIKRIVKQADTLSAFGWVQERNRGPGGLVGEFRGSKETAAIMERFLRNPWKSGAPHDYVADIHIYPDTKIRLHFSHFKVLHPDRITCFESKPHECEPDEIEQIRNEL